jgi:hypothetical protein
MGGLQALFALGEPAQLGVVFLYDLMESFSTICALGEASFFVFIPIVCDHKRKAVPVV